MVRWRARFATPGRRSEADDVEVVSPGLLASQPGEELFLWYSDAGAQAASAEERHRATEAFRAQYGFSPWE